MTKAPKAVLDAARLQRRSERDRTRRFLVEGAQGVREALASDPLALEGLFTSDPLDPLAIEAERLGLPVDHIDPAALARIASTVTPQAVVGVAPFLDGSIDDIEADGCLVLLHEVRDPGNAGTVLRSADAAGSSGVVFTSASVDVYNPKTVRASAGSIFHLPVARDVELPAALDDIRARGVRVLAMAADEGQSLYAADLTGPVAFLFGNEAHGLTAADRSLADVVVHVPQPGRAESLNLAAAATICLFEWARRRRGAMPPLEAVITAAAHDIRSPLTALKGFSHALERRWAQMTDEERGLMLTGIAHDADRMEQVLRLLVDAARVADGSLDVFLEPTDVEATVAEITRAQARDPDHPPLVWTGERGPFLVDPARLRTAIFAASEALVWWGASGPIRALTSREGDDLHLRLERVVVPELTAGDLEPLFEARTAGSGGGTKLGLFVTRAVARAQGGDAWAELDGQLLSIHLRLPLPG